VKKLESGFRTLLKTKEVDHLTVWEEVRPKLEGDPAFDTITPEFERVRIFKVFTSTLPFPIFLLTWFFY